MTTESAGAAIELDGEIRNRLTAGFSPFTIAALVGDPPGVVHAPDERDALATTVHRRVLEGEYEPVRCHVPAAIGDGLCAILERFISSFGTFKVP
ncbi:hypothetical protein [Natrarchaeobius chitinivorans]|uniref:Uncharacterized protein n=1 Tax=Natrarchaeobius chitinivorans TaxID=1679083 RepID=A0A3N6N2S5_NATCH|nr:hypothetical protein [Natrarchaeobius chitinivorans]RQG92352.1 hypothetical protein EA473_16330 [Natrarchaeobius chitinivorans]